MPIFRDRIDQAVDLLGRQCSVSLTSMRGGGRTWFCRQTLKQLEDLGRRAFSITGVWALRKTPYGAMGSEVEETPQPGDFHRFAERLARTAVEGQSPIVIIDDAHFLDSFSVALIESLRSRVRFSTLVSYPTSVKAINEWQPVDRQIVESWSNASIELPPLAFESVSELASRYLGAPVSAQLAGRLFAMAAGNPLITTDILRTAKWANLLEFHRGVWSNPSGNLWSPQLHRIAEAYLQDLEVAQRELLLAIAIAGPMGYGELTKKLDSGRLLELEQAGFITLLDGEEQNAPLVMATPGLLAEYLRRDASPVTQRRVSAMARDLFMRPALEDDPHQVVPAHHAAMVEHLQDVGARQVGMAMERWESSPSTKHAHELIKTAYAHHFDSKNLLRFTETIRANPPSDDHLMLKCAMLEADVLAYHELQSPAALHSLELVAEARPSISPQVKAYSLLVEAMTSQMPSDYQQALRSLLGDTNDPVVLTVLGFLLAVDYRPAEALDCLARVDRGDSFPQLDALHLVAEAAALQQLGRVDEALALSARASEESRAKFDRSGMIAAAYASMQTALETGNWDKSHVLLGEVVGLVPGGLATIPFHAPLVRIAASAAAVGGNLSAARGLFAEVNRFPGPTGPFAGQHEDFFREAERLMEQPEDAPRRFAVALARSGQRYLEKGYVHTAYTVWSAAFFAEPSARTLARIEGICAERQISIHEDLWRLARLVVERDWKQLREEAVRVDAGSRFPQFSRLLQAALAAEMARNPNGAENSVLQAVAEQFGVAKGTPLPVTFAGANSGLSSREKEIGLLASSLSNAEIAQRLGISTRTVEKHISNALHKLGVTDRHHLYEKLRGSAPQSHLHP